MMNSAILEEDGNRFRRVIEQNVEYLQPQRRQRVFISFDFDHDKELKDALVGQSKYPNSPFDFFDGSLKEAAPQSQWRDRAAGAVQRAHMVLVICGAHTASASGVQAEVSIAKGQRRYVAYLKGRPNQKCFLPSNAHQGAQMIPWKWDNLHDLLSYTDRHRFR